ncbi:MAG: alpha/beta hydrolase [Caldilineaceae bacterium]
MPIVTLDQQPIFFERHNQHTAEAALPPVLFIHGAGGTCLQWPPQARRLPQVDVYAVDLPGHARSPAPGRATIAAYSDLLLKLTDQLALPPFVAVGHSMGGAIALEMALCAPARLAGLVLVGTGASLRVNPALLVGIRDEFDATTAQLVEWMYAAKLTAKAHERALTQLRATPPAVLYDDFAACAAFDRRDKVATIKAPTLIICGAADKMTPVKWSESLHQAIDHSHLHIVEGAGHMVMVEKPKVVTDLLANFVTTLTITE